MPTPRVAMRKIKECLRLKLDCDLSHECIALALGLSKGVVSKYVARAEAAGLDWPALSALDEAQIAAQLCEPTPVVCSAPAATVDNAPLRGCVAHRCGLRPYAHSLRPLKRKRRSRNGRVEMWRGGGRFGITVAASLRSAVPYCPDRDSV